MAKTKPPGDKLSLFGLLLIVVMVLSLWGIIYLQALGGNILIQSTIVPGNAPLALQSTSSPVAFATDWLALKQTAEAARGQTEQVDVLTSPPRCLTGIPPQITRP